MPAALEIPLALNLTAVFVGGLGGALRASEDDRIDIVGVFAMALCMGFGGGIVRDLFLGNLPPAAFRNPAYLLTVAAATAVGSLFLAQLPRIDRLLVVLDSLSIGLFAAVGANASLIAGLATLPAVFIGGLASVGGLILAELLQATPSSLLHAGPPNAIAGLAGACTFCLTYGPVGTFGATILAVVVTLAIRLTAIIWNLQTRPVREVPHRYGRWLRRRRPDRDEAPGQ